MDGVVENLSAAVVQNPLAHEASRQFRQVMISVPRDQQQVPIGLRVSVQFSPCAARHLTRIEVRYASWDLGHIHLVDERTGSMLARLYPQDKTQNASGLRRTLDPVSTASAKPVPTPVAPDPTMPPLLARMLDKQATTGLAPPYLPKDDATTDDATTDDGETS